MRQHESVLDRPKAGDTVNRPIALIEPQMKEHFHAPFNAALLHAVVLAYPDSTVSFRGFPAHLHAVRDILSQHASSIVGRVEWRGTDLPATTSLPARWRHSRQLLREALAKHERVLFCSISRMQLLQLKRMMQRDDVVRVVLHGDLDQIEQPVEDRFPLNLVSMQHVLLRPNPQGLRFILLGKSIRENLPQTLRAAMGEIGIVDHPYHFFPIQSGSRTPYIFGIFGNTGDGRQLEQVACAVKASNPDIRFRLVGFLSGSAAVERLEPLMEYAGCIPIPRQVFVDRAQSCTHALWLADPNGFRLRASGTLFDALSFAKPLVYTANPYIDAYYRQEPGIGVRCAALDEVPRAILNLTAQETAASYAQALEAIKRLRARFTPENLAKGLHMALYWGFIYFTPLKGFRRIGLARSPQSQPTAPRPSPSPTNTQPLALGETRAQAPSLSSPCSGDNRYIHQSSWCICLIP
jgi:hypothetical protein